MNQIHQENRTGCGIACVAMVISNGTYSKVMEVARILFSWPESQRTFYTSSLQLQELLLAFNVRPKKGRSIKKWTSLPATAIVGINHNELTEKFHWVVYRREADTQYVLDPRSKREVRKDFGRMRLRSCIPIEQQLL